MDVSGDGNGRGYDFTTGGITIGADYPVTNNFAVGIAVGYAHSGTNLNGGGSIDTNSGRGLVYATLFEGGFYLGGYVGGGYNSYDTKRAALGGAATGTTVGGEFNALVSGGYDLHCGSLTFGPVASFGYIYVNFAGFTEQGSVAPLRIVSEGEDSLRTNLRMRISYALKAKTVTLTPTLQVSWQHEYSFQGCAGGRFRRDAETG